jgi:hypothetical protein
VTRDPSFLTAKFKELEDVWNKIVYYRQNKDAFMNEVVQEQEIKTEPFKKQNNNMFEQYMFRDL